MRPDVNSCVNSIRIFATSNNYMWTTGNLLKERNFPQASLLSHLPKQIKFFLNEFKFPGSLRKTCLSVIGWGNSVITTYKKKIKRKLNLSTNMEAWWYNSLILKKKNVTEIHVDFFFLFYAENYVFVAHRSNKWCIWSDWLGFWLHLGRGNQWNTRLVQYGKTLGA